MRINDNGIYRDMTPEEEALYTYTPSPEERIAMLKSQLAETDYKAIKYAEGWISEEDYASIKVEREAIRQQIRELGG